MRDYQGSNSLISLALLIMLYVLATALYLHSSILSNMSTSAYVFLISWLLIAIMFAFLSYKEFVPGYLISFFGMIIAWRIAGIYDLYSLSVPLLFVFLLYIANFIYCAHINLQFPDKFRHKISLSEWQLVFVRLYLGLNFIPHFTEKLFAGQAPRELDIKAFTGLGLNDPAFFVWLAGLCEFAAAIGVGLGFLIRLAALGAVLYLMIATYLGHHFVKGFIWANPGGGWEYATMWMVLIFAFALTKSHQFSIDQYLEDRFKIYYSLKKAWRSMRH